APRIKSWFSNALKFSVFPVSITPKILVGLGLILGGLTKTAAFFGIIMNLSFLLSGTVSVNPNLLILTMFILVAGQNAGRIGLDGYVFPKLFRKNNHRTYKLSKTA
ncbi:hypothetical protein ACT4US_15705, partial [Bacillus sp. HC-Mk]